MLSQETKVSYGKHLLIQRVCHTKHDDKTKGKRKATVRTQAELEVPSYTVRSKQSLIISTLTVVNCIGLCCNLSTEIPIFKVILSFFKQVP